MRRRSKGLLARPPLPPLRPPAPYHRPETDRAGKSRRLWRRRRRRWRRGDSGDRERRRLAAAATPPIVSGLLGATGSASRRGAGCLAAHPLLQPPKSALPPPPALGPRRPSSTRSPVLRENEAVAAAAAAFSGACDSLTAAIDGRRRGFHGGIYLRPDRAAGIKEREERTRAGWKGQPPGTFPSPAVSGSSGPCLPTPSLTHLPPPSGPPAGPCRTLEGLFREGVKAVLWVLSAGADTFFEPVEDDLLFSRSK